MCSTTSFPFATMVWPALSPPLNLTTQSAPEASRSTIFPLPSSPQYAPMTIVFMESLQYIHFWLGAAVSWHRVKHSVYPENVTAPFILAASVNKYAYRPLDRYSPFLF